MNIGLLNEGYKGVCASVTGSLLHTLHQCNTKCWCYFIMEISCMCVCVFVDMSIWLVYITAIHAHMFIYLLEECPSDAYPMPSV